MKEYIYLVGQISADENETYSWRERVREYFILDNDITIIDPCNNKFNQEVKETGAGDPRRLKVYKMNGTGLLVPKDKSYVNRATIIFANMNTYDSDKPIIGSFYELAWTSDNPATSVIGIFAGDPTNDVICNHPFVRASVDIWVKNEMEACEMVEYYYLDMNHIGTGI